MLTPPTVVNPLTVSVSRSGKKRLNLDLRQVKTHVRKQKIEFEDIRTASHFFLSQDNFMLKFDLKSVYHQIDILEDHRKFLGFSWFFSDQKIPRDFVFTVLPFGLSSAHYIFTKLVRELVKFLRLHAIRATVYLDDGLVSVKDYSKCLNSSMFVRNTLYSATFLPSQAKSVWQSTQKLVWLDYDIGLLNHLISILVKRVKSALDATNRLLASRPITTARILAQFLPAR